MNKKNIYIGQKGYTIYKNELTKVEIDKIKKDLTIKPFSFNNQYSDIYHVYRESNNKLYIPRYYGIKHFGEPKFTHFTEIYPKDNDNIYLFNGKLRDYQENIVNAYVEKIIKKKNGCGLIEIGCGKGKCLARNTKILMFNGFYKKVQDIKIGDILMGDDSTPRNVLSICKGRDIMYKISSENHNFSYITNEQHILSLKNIFGKTIFISVKHFFKNPLLKNILFGYKVPIHFKEQKLNYDPYILGYMFGLYNMNYKVNIDNIIPNECKVNSHYILKFFINGFLNVFDKHIEQNKININISSQTKNVHIFLKDIQYIFNVLGFEIFIYKNSKLNLIYLNIYKYKNIYYQLYKIQCTLLNEDDYYGFEIDGNRCFVLEDFSVTHNTVCALNIVSIIKMKTLVIIHKDFLMTQWKERIEQYLPNIKVGRIQGQIIDIEDKDIVLAMLQSLSMKEYHFNIFKDFGFTIIDEVHHISSKVFSCALFKICSRFMLGLSATMKRTDGTSYVFQMFLGDIIYKDIEKKDDNIIVKCIHYKHDDEEFNKLYYDFKGNICISKMINKITQFEHRTYFIINILKCLLIENNKQQIMIISQYKNILHKIYQIILNENQYSIGYYIGGMKNYQLKKSEEKQIVLATYSMASEGLDIKTLTTLFMVSPMTNIEQPIGRILRQKHDFPPLVIDIVDSHFNFKNQWNKRKLFYNKNKYNVYNLKYKDAENWINNTLYAK